MIKEIVEFTKTLDEGFKSMAYKPSSGLHLLININGEGELYLEQHIIYDGEVDIETEEMELVAFYEKNSSYISMNQQQKFDKNQKVHSASPFSFAFNFSLGNNKKDIQRELQSKIDKGEIDKTLDLASKEYKMEETKKRISEYFENAKKLCLKDNDSEILLIIDKFQDFCSKKLFDLVVELTTEKNISKKKDVEKIELISILEELKEKDYVRLYLKCIKNLKWVEAYSNYYESEYPPNEYKENDFLTTYNAKKVFNIHQTATFDKNLFIKGSETKILQEFLSILSVKPKRILPNPLPIFIYKEELQKKLIATYKESGFSLSYKELIEKMWDNHKDDFGNYYLLYWTRGKETFKDFDFVSKFEYDLKDSQGRNWEVEDLFGVNYQFKIENVFAFQSQIMQITFNNSLIVKTKEGGWVYKYFDDIEEKYCKSARNYLIIMQYRKAFYDFIYKSKRQAINIEMFHDIMKTSILEDIRLDEIKNNNHSEYFNIRKKLNIWFSLYEKFDLNFNLNHKTMASKLTDYQQFVAAVANESADLSKANTEEFAFAAGQVIYYILKKSKSADQSYQRLERYLNQAHFAGFQQVISTEFARYKHESFSRRFERVASFVLTYETTEQVKKYLPQILAGAFASNQLYSEKETETTEDTTVS